MEDVNSTLREDANPLSAPNLRTGYPSFNLCMQRPISSERNLVLNDL